MSNRRADAAWKRQRAR